MNSKELFLLGNFFATSLLIRVMTWFVDTYISLNLNETEEKILPVIYLFIIIILIRLFLGICRIYSPRVFVAAWVESLIIVSFISYHAFTP